LDGVNGHPSLLENNPFLTDGSASEGIIMIGQRLPSLKPNSFLKATGHLSPSRGKMLISTILFM
jgi:hypothetical protein